MQSLVLRHMPSNLQKLDRAKAGKIQRGREGGREGGRDRWTDCLIVSVELCLQ